MTRHLLKLAWTRLQLPGLSAAASVAAIPKPWRTPDATPGCEAASLVMAEKLIGDDVLAAAREEISKLQFDRDADSVDGSPTFEVSWVREGKFCHAGLTHVFKQTIEDKLTPLIQSVPHLHGLADGTTLVLCDALVRTYDEGHRRQHPAHYDSQALVTAVFEIDMGCGGFDGPGFYVQPDAHVSSRLPIAMSSGDVIAHSFDLQHGVEVHAGRRCSVVFWFADSADSCASGRQPWYETAAARGDADAQYNLACQLLSTDEARAQALMRASAVQGHFVAQLAFGVMLMNFEMAARGATDHEGLLRSFFSTEGEETNLFESPVYLESERWIRASADRGYYRAMIQLHARRMQQGGHAVEALAWLTMAAEQRADAPTMHALAAAHRDGDNGCAVVDLETARRWFTAAANQGHPESQLEMGKLGGPDSERWLTLASEHGMSEASRALALRYAMHGEALKLMRLIGQCWRRLRWSSSKVSAAALPSVPLMGGV
jgi:TPR repeat protein